MNPLKQVFATHYDLGWYDDGFVFFTRSFLSLGMPREVKNQAVRDMYLHAHFLIELRTDKIRVRLAA